MGLKDILATDGPRLAMMALAGAQGGPQGLSALLEGGRIRDQQAAQMAQQQQAAAQADELHRARVGNLEADNTRQAQQQQLDKLRQALALIEQETNAQAETAADPVQAENAVMQKARLASSVFGLPPDQLTGLVPNMTPKVAAAQKRRAKEKYAEFLRAYGDQATALAQTAKVESGEFAGKTFAEVGQIAEAVAPPPPPPKPMQIIDRGGTKEVVDPAALRPGQTFPDVPGPTAPGSGPNGLTPNASLEGTLKLRDRFIKETQAATAVNTQFRLMQSSLEAVKRGAAAPGSQGVLVTFQKILDPTSVVRESEYARSASGLSLLSRMEGAWDKIEKGGAGVPTHDLEQFVQLAEQFVRNQAQAAEATKAQIEAIATQHGLKPEHITRELGLPGGTGNKKYEIISVK